MRLQDPLATFHYIGGALPIHVTMLFYAVYELVYSYLNINCTQLSLDFSKLDDCKDIKLMISVHAVAVGTFIIRKSCMSE